MSIHSRLLLCLFIATSLSCSSDDSAAAAEDNVLNGNALITATVNGEFLEVDDPELVQVILTELSTGTFVFNFAGGVMTGSTIKVIGVACGGDIADFKSSTTFTGNDRNGFFALGTYQVKEGENDTVNAIVADNDTSASVTITSHNTNQKSVSGTFNFVAVQGNQTYTVTNGRFTDLSY